MRFEWDEAKNQANIVKHGIDFKDAISIFNDAVLTNRDNSANYGEERWISIGWLKSIIAVVVYTELTGDVIRIISARKATKKEASYYEQYIKPN